MKHKNLDIPGKTFDLGNYIIMVSLLIVCVYPFYYIFIYSISNSYEAQKGILLLPKGFTLSNYQSIFLLKGMFNSSIISILRTVIGTLLTIFCCSFFAYLVTKKELILRKMVYRLVVITMYFNAGLIPWYLTMKMFHLNNNFLLYIIPTAISGYYVILLKTFIEQLPAALEESAKIDGAGVITIFVKLIFPLSAPIIATIGVFAAVGQWNTWYDNYFLVESPKLRTLQLVLYTYLSQANSVSQASSMEMTRGQTVRQITPEAVRMTITMVVTLPVLFIYPLLQRYFMKGLLLGAVKG